MAEVILKPGRQERLLAGHPWIYRTEVGDVRGAWAPGDALAILDARGRFLGRAHYNPRPTICCRVLTRRDEPVDAAFFRRRLEAALAYRREAGLVAGAYRLCWSEADGLPGLVVDRYGEASVLVCLTLGMARATPAVRTALGALFPGQAVYRADDATAARIEGFTAERGWLGPDGAPVPPAEAVPGSASSEAGGPLETAPGGGPELVVPEGPCRFVVPLGGGQKTGLYLDQRDNRQRVAAHAAGRRVLDAFCYTGGFACQALAAGASRALLVESSAEALAGARRNLELNGLGDRADLVEGNAFDVLRRLEATRERFGLAVLDPPPFTRRREALPAAARGYKEINLRALRLLAPGGVLATFSCSHHVSPGFFADICREAAGDAGIPCRVLADLGQSRDHPVLLNVPETRYLTGLLLQVL
jgi:23S rRNA (cytosine1962-C5)-methyltransferase